MGKCFNITGDCKPALHYMVDIESRLIQIKKLVDEGAYFTILSRLFQCLEEWCKASEKPVVPID